MASVRFADIQSRPLEFLDFTSLTPRRVSAADPTLRGRLPRAYGGVAPRWETPDRPPVCRLQELPFTHTGRSPVLYPHIPEDIQPPSGAGTPVRHGPKQSAQWIHVLLPALLAALRTLGDASA